MLILGGKAETEAGSRRLAQEALANGTAWERFKRLVSRQGGDVRFVEEPERLPTAPVIRVVESPETGYLARIDAREVGETAVILGAGRARKGESIDHAVGIEILHKIGDSVRTGQPLIVVHAGNETAFEVARQRLLLAHQWSREPLDPLPHFYGVIR